jgi:hypothetical protein
MSLPEGALYLGIAPLRPPASSVAIWSSAEVRSLSFNKDFLCPISKWMSRTQISEQLLESGIEHLPLTHLLAVAP